MISILLRLIVLWRYSLVLHMGGLWGTRTKMTWLWSVQRRPTRICWIGLLSMLSEKNIIKGQNNLVFGTMLMLSIVIEVEVCEPIEFAIGKVFWIICTSCFSALICCLWIMNFILYWSFCVLKLSKTSVVWVWYR